MSLENNQFLNRLERKLNLIILFLNKRAASILLISVAPTDSYYPLRKYPHASPLMLHACCDDKFALCHYFFVYEIFFKTYTALCEDENNKKKEHIVHTNPVKLHFSLTASEWQKCPVYTRAYDEEFSL